MAIRAAVDGQEITFEDGNQNVKRRHSFEIEAIEVENSIPAGFRVSWLEGGNDEYEIELLSGAGFGSKYAVLYIKDKASGEMLYDGVIDAEELVAAWVASALAKDTAWRLHPSCQWHILRRGG